MLNEIYITYRIAVTWLDITCRLLGIVFILQWGYARYREVFPTDLEAAQDVAYNVMERNYLARK